MVNIYVLQTDNRPSLNYLLETQKVNKKFCEILKYDYLFLELDNNKYGNINPATKKIHLVNDFLLNTKCDILVFLDSDAWIQNGYFLNDIINNLIINNEKHGCFSRDPYLKKNTFINSGSFIIKNNDFIKKMYNNLIKELENNNICHNNWPYDQYYISKYVFENKTNFTIFNPDILNTPIGIVLRHNWLKNSKMYHDLSILYSNINNDSCFGKTYFIEKNYYDEKKFPNLIENGYEYFNLNNSMNIVSVFSGRRSNIEILNKYLKKALELKIIDEVHFWNNTRNKEDEDYLKNISNLKRTSSTGSGNYILITPLLLNNSFELNIKASNDIHIKITNIDTEYEIVLGGWSNTKSVIRENNYEICNLLQNGIADENNFVNFKISINNNILNILKNDELIICYKIKNNFEIKNIYFKTGHNCVGDLSYNITQNKGFYFMDTCEKSWKNYYSYYSNSKFENDIIIKCDDDIVFIDLNKLPKFIEFVKKNDYDLVLANTINNGVSAYYQQNKYNLIPKELMILELPVDGLEGTLWGSGNKAEELHNYFIDNYKKFLDYEYNNEIIEINTRFSINFFGYKGRNWHKLINAYNGSDEHNLTVDYVINKQFKNVMYSDFYVSHLSFFKQNETGINLNKLIEKYHRLYSAIE